MPYQSKQHKQVHHQVFRSFFGWRQPAELHLILSERIVQLRIQGTIGMILTVTQLFGDSSVHPRAKEKAMGYMTELMAGEDLALFVPEGIMPQVVSSQPISPIPAHICLGGCEETVAEKLKQRGYLKPS